MIYSISIHRPKPEHEQDVIDSMHRYGEAAGGQPGLHHVHTFRARDEDPPVLVGLAVWESAEAKKAAASALEAAVGDDPFEEWDREPIQGFLLDEV
jgi:heme-degrading monooxygenase HmoA